MTISINQDISFHDPNTITIDGGVTSNKTATAVRVSVNDAEGATAALNKDGTWDFTAAVNGSKFDKFVATVSYTDGTSETSTSLFVEAAVPLDHQVASFKEQSNTLTGTIYNMQGRGLYDVSFGAVGEGGVSDVTGRGGPSIAYTDFMSTAETIENFRAQGPRHDTLNLSDTSLHTLAAVLHHTTMSDGSATIHLDPQSSVTLVGVTKQQLATNPNDLVFTGGHTLNGAT